MCAELATKSHSSPAAVEAECIEVCEWPADFATLPRDAKQRVIDSQLERITTLQIHLDTAGAQECPSCPIIDMEEDALEVAEFGDQCPEPPPAEIVQFDRASSFTGPNRVAPVPLVILHQPQGMRS